MIMIFDVLYAFAIAVLPGHRIWNERTVGREWIDRRSIWHAAPGQASHENIVCGDDGAADGPFRASSRRPAEGRRGVVSRTGPIG
jgi:hypothetical protein